MGKFPSVRPESVMTQTMDDDGHDYAGKDDDDRHHDHHRHRHHDDEEVDKNELITKSHAAAICTTYYLHNQRGHKVHCIAMPSTEKIVMICLHYISLDILWIFFGYSLGILGHFVQTPFFNLTIKYQHCD